MFFAILNGIILALFFLGFRIHLFGLFGGIMDFLFYGWAVSTNQNLTTAAGTIVMNFGIITVEPGYGWIGPIMALAGILASIVYAGT